MMSVTGRHPHAQEHILGQMLKRTLHVCSCRKQVGKRIILGSNFVGGPRHLQQVYQDGMAIVRKSGKADLFVTFTCNPNWPEIKENLLPGQTAAQRPDLVARVFELRLKRLLKELTKDNVLGEVLAHLLTIEWQKRGLPHAHILLIFKALHWLRTVDEYDSVISAQIPDPVENPYLHELVMKHIVHGPCGVHNPALVCILNRV